LPLSSTSDLVINQNVIEIKRLKGHIHLLDDHICSLENNLSVYNGSLVYKSAFVDNNVTKTFDNAMLAYNGPLTVVTSLRRYHTVYSAHYKGKASDMRLNRRVIHWLQSTAEGQRWLNTYNLTYIIEFPKRNARYYRYKKEYKKVVINNLATHEHIHIQIKKNH